MPKNPLQNPKPNTNKQLNAFCFELQEWITLTQTSIIFILKKPGISIKCKECVSAIHLVLIDQDIHHIKIIILHMWTIIRIIIYSIYVEEDTWGELVEIKECYFYFQQ